MKNLKVLLSILATTLFLTLTLTSCGGGGGGSDGNNNSGDSGSDVGTFLNGKWAATSPNRNFVLNGNTWVYSESTPNYSKGTWKSSVKPDAGITTTLTLTVTQITNGSGGWMNPTPEVNNVKTNTATCVINSAGTQMTISNPALTTSGVWGTLAGTYTKE